MKLSDDLLPVQAFFNAIGEADFVDQVAKLVRGVGCAINEASCEFPEDLDPGEKPFAGVRFSLFDEEVVLDRKAFADVLERACRAHVEDYPADRTKLAELLRESRSEPAKHDA